MNPSKLDVLLSFGHTRLTDFIQGLAGKGIKAISGDFICKANVKKIGHICWK